MQSLRSIPPVRWASVHPRLAAKVAKCSPWEYTDVDVDVAIWIDGCVEIHTADFVSWCLDFLGDGVLAMHHAAGRFTLGAVLAVAALAASSLVPYVRAKSETVSALATGVDTGRRTYITQVTAQATT